MKLDKIPGGDDKRWFDQRDEGIQGIRVTDDALRVWKNVEELGLLNHVAELDIKGYTVVPPSKTRMRVGWVSETRDKIFDIAERRFGKRPGRDPDVGETIAAGLSMSHILDEDPVFEEALLNPVALALAETIVGRKAVMSSSVAGIKGPSDKELALHTDALCVPSPFPAICPGVNMTWALTPYTRDDGCLCVVPGSHKLYRHPLPGEGIDQRVAVEAEEGSLIMWGEYTWHGAYARKNAGYRVNLIGSVQRPYMRSKERWDDFPAERAATNPRLAEIARAPMGWGKEGPQYDPFSDNVNNAYD